jgi:hypothetical protein
MGLDAMVYFSVKNLPKTLLPHMYTRDEASGECFTTEEYDHLGFEFRACHHRLGNLFGIAELGERLREMGVREESVLLKDVLYSGTHCGDFIPRSEIPRLDAEVAALEARGDQEIKPFLESMRDLIEVAKREENAIVF